MKAKTAIETLSTDTESGLKVQVDGADVHVKKIEIVEWTDGARIPSFYTDKEVAKIRRMGERIGPLKKLGKPYFRLVTMPT